MGIWNSHFECMDRNDALPCKTQTYRKYEDAGLSLTGTGLHQDPEEMLKFFNTDHS